MAIVARADMLQRIFISGRNRSGTKWLNSIISGHPDVATVESELHRGALESNVFSRVPEAFGPWHLEENFRAFTVFYAATDFFRLTGLDPFMLQPDSPRPYLQVFREVMDEYAVRQGASAWAQKSSTLPLFELYSFFDKAKFVLTDRDAVNSMASSIALRQRTLPDEPKRLVREAAGHALEASRTSRLIGNPRVLLVRYEDLRSDREAAVRRVFEFLDLAPHTGTDRFARNTSFPGRNRVPVMSPWERAVARGLVRAWGAVPLPWLETWQRRSMARRPPNLDRRFVRGTFWDSTAAANEDVDDSE